MSSIVDELQFRQGDLGEICRKPVPALRELTSINHQYGIGDLFRQYASLPADEPLAFSIDHGVALNPDGILESDFASGLPAFINSYPERAEYYRQHGMPRVEASALAVHYARLLLERDWGWKEPEHRRGTIAFPHKSAASCDRSFDFDSYARSLLDLPEEFQPVCVCIYWKDYLKDRHLAYLEKGIPVVTCGHFYDPKFLHRFVELCHRFKYSCSNSIASSYPLSVACGCQFFYNNVGAIQVSETSGRTYEVVNPGEKLLYGSRLKALAPFPPNPALLREQQELCDFLTGAGRILSPEEIREMQGWARQWLLDRQTDEISFAAEVEVKTLNTWLPKNIYPDGWAGAKSGLVVKPQEGGAILRAWLKFSKSVHDGRQPITFSWGEKESLQHDCAPVIYELTIPLPASQACPVTFQVPHEVDQSGEGNRRVAFRFLGWQIVKGAAGKPQCRRLEHGEHPPSFVSATGKSVDADESGRGVRRWLKKLAPKK